MTPDEAKQLLARATAFDNRQPSLIATHAWAAALHDIPLDDDAVAAVAAYYGQIPAATDRYDPARRRWLEPHHVRYHRRQIRDARHSAANPMYGGNPDETPIESARNLRQLNAAAASGRIPPQTVPAALPSGREPVDATGRGRAILRSVGRESPSRRPEFAAPCPHPPCLAEAGKPCVNRTGGRRRDAHPSRVQASLALSTGQPATAPEHIRQEIAQRRAAAAAAIAGISEPPEPDDDFDPVHRTRAAKPKTQEADA